MQGVHYMKAPERDSIGDNASVQTLVSEIIADVRKRGDAAVRDYASKFDKAELAVFEVTQQEREDALAELDPQTRADTEFAISNVRRFAEAQLATIQPLEIELRPGLHLGHRVIPIQRVGCLCARRPLSAALGTDHDDCAGQGCGLRRGCRVSAAQRAQSDDRGLPSFGRGPDL